MTDYKLVQVEGLRYTFDGALAECPCCGSLDVGGAHDTVHCQSCGLTVTKPGPLQNAIDAWNTRTSRAHSAAPAVQGEPVAVLYADGTVLTKAECGDSFAVCCKVQTPLYAAPQPAEQQSAPDVAGLESALKSMVSGYMRLLQSGYDRITDLGGDCDPVDVMERDDAYLREARATLAAHRKQGGEM